MEPQEGKHFTLGTIDQLGHCVKHIKRKAPPFPLLYPRKSWYKEGPGALTSTEKEEKGWRGFQSVLRFSLLLYAHTDAPTRHVCRSKHESLYDCKVVIKLNLTFAAPLYLLGYLLSPFGFSS